MRTGIRLARSKESRYFASVTTTCRVFDTNSGKP